MMFRPDHRRSSAVRGRPGSWSARRPHRRRVRRLAPGWVAVFLACVAGIPAMPAQEPGGGSASPASGSSEGSASPVPSPPADPTAAAAPGRGQGGPLLPTAPDIYYLEDDRGRLVPVPGFGYADFMEMLRLRQGLPGVVQPPPALLESLSLTLDLPGAGGGRDCRAAFDATLRQTRAGWCSVPLDLAGLILDGPPTHEGDGTVVIDAESAAGRGGDGPPGYRCWLQGPADGRHRVAGRGRLPLETAGDELSLWVRMPAATATALVLRTAHRDPLVTLTPAGVEPRVESVPDGGSVVTCVGLVGPTQVRIGPRGTSQATAGAAPEASVESLVRIDGRIAAWQTLLTLRNLPADLSQVTVTLPPGATARGVRGGTIARRETVAPAPAGELPVERLSVDISPSADGRAVVEFDAERSIDPEARVLEPLGFMVEQVLPWRQHGRVSLAVEGDWQLEWDDAGRARRVDPPAAARRPGLSAAFAYDTQPATLPIHVRARGSRVVVEPEYRYTVDPGRIGLEARIRLSVRGAPINRLALRLDDWAIDDVAPAGLVDAAAIRVEDGVLFVPFLQPLAGDATIEVRCGRAVDREERRLAWTIPVPEADLVAPASVTVSAASDIEIVPDGAAIRGLVRQASPTAPRDAAERSVLTYRLDGTDGTFVADRRYLSQRIEAAVATTISLTGDVAVVDETIRYTVAHVALESIDLTVPEAVVVSGALELRQSGQPLNPFPVPTTPRSGTRGETPPSTDGTGIVNLRALLPQPLLGSGELTIRYELPMAAVPADATAALDVPLVLPAEGRITRQSLGLVVEGALAVDVRAAGWERDTLPSSAARAWTSARPQATVPLAVSARQGTSSGDTVVEGAWFETRVLPDAREDLCTYTVSSSARRFELAIPEAWRADGTRAATIDVRVDGRPVPTVVRPDGRLTVELPFDGNDVGGRGAWVVAIECRSNRDAVGPAWLHLAGWIGPLALEAPLPATGVVQRRSYWELRLLADEHVVVPPRRWTSQQRWTWSGGWFERRPVVSREALARWLETNRRLAADRAAGGDTGSAVTDLDPPLAERRAVWSAVGPLPEARVWLVPTWLLVAVSSGTMLGLGLLAVHVRSARQPAAVVGVITALLAAAAFRPELAPLVAQAAIPGALLAALAGALRRWSTVTVPRAAAPRPSLIVSPQSSTRLVVLADGARPALPTEPPTAAGRALP